VSGLFYADASVSSTDAGFFFLFDGELILNIFRRKLSVASSFFFHLLFQSLVSHPKAVGVLFPLSPPFPCSHEITPNFLSR